MLFKGNEKFYLQISFMIILLAFASISFQQQLRPTRTLVAELFSDTKSSSDPKPINITFRLLAVERYFDSVSMRSGQYLIRSLLNTSDPKYQYFVPLIKNWQNMTWGNFRYTSYIHLLSCDVDVKNDQQMKKYYRGVANKTNIINEIRNFLGVTGPGESNELTVRIFYYCDHSGKLIQFGNFSLIENYLLVGEDPKNKDHVITASELDQALLSGDLKTSNCTVIIFDSCYSGGFINRLARPGRTIITACTNQELAQSRGVKEGEEPLDWSIFTGNQLAYYINKTTKLETEFGALGIIGAIYEASKSYGNNKFVNFDSNKDGWLTAKEMFRFAAGTTKVFTKFDYTTNPQNPQFYSQVLDGGVPLVMYYPKKIKIFQDPMGRIYTFEIETPFIYNPPVTSFDPFWHDSARGAPRHETFKFDPERTGFYNFALPQQTITTNDNLLWNSSVIGQIIGSPMINDGQIYVASSLSTNESRVDCLETMTGDILWSLDLIQGKTLSSMTLGEGKIFLGTSDPSNTLKGKLYAIDQCTGNILWNISIGSHVSSSPTISEGMLIFTTSINETASGAWSLNVTTGEPIWNFTFLGKSLASPAIFERKVFVATYEGCIFAIEQYSGNQLWNISINDRIFSTPAAADGLLFIGTLGVSGNANLLAVNTENGDLIWSTPFPSPIYSSPAVDYENGMVIVCGEDGTIQALNEFSGSLIWENHVGPINMSSPLIAKGGVIYVGSLDSNIYSLDEETGQILGCFATGAPIESSPAMRGPHVLTGSLNGQVFCFGPEFPSHNIAVTGIEISPATAEIGNIVNITVTVTNKGNVPDTFSLICAYNNTDVWQAPTYISPMVFYNDTVTLGPTENVTLTYQLNTTGMDIGMYSLLVYVPEVEYEVDGSDNVVKSVGLKIIGHDVAVRDIETCKTIIGQGLSLIVYVNIVNLGDFTESFSLTAYATNIYEIVYEIGQTTVTLDSQQTKTVTFTWNTTEVDKGNYTMVAYIIPVPNEANESNNILVNGWVIVAMIGDITGPDGCPDGKVDIRDVARVAILFGVNYPDPRYDPNCDLTGPTPGVADGKIDIRDIALIAKHFGEIDP